jgi:hypothetical protein
MFAGATSRLLPHRPLTAPQPEDPRGRRVATPHDQGRGLRRTPGGKILPIKLSIDRVPFGIVTLKNRTLSPVAQLFIEHAREVARTPAKGKR